MSIYDRDYMREKANGKSPFEFLKGSPSKVLIFINVVAFVIQAFGENAMGRDSFNELFGLSWGALLSGKFWTLITYSFMHGSLLHIFCNMLGLWFIGQSIEKFLGVRKFCVLYFSGAIIGGLLWLLLSLANTANEVLIGASASVMSVFAAFCLFYPPMPITFLLFFVIPISMRPMTMLKITAAMEVLGLFASFWGASSSVAYSAHLGGMLAGLAFAYLLRRGRLNFIDTLKMPKFSQRKSSRGGNASDYSFKVNISNPSENDDEINRILDKISVSGFSSLTEQERQTLRNARDTLKNR